MCPLRDETLQLHVSTSLYVCILAPLLGCHRKRKANNQFRIFSVLLWQSLVSQPHQGGWAEGLMCTGSSLDQLVMVAGGNLGDAVEE